VLPSLQLEVEPTKRANIPISKEKEEMRENAREER
jgi:hypothetical protein